MVVYHCHAGLVEATAPLKDGGVIIGYVMFGQIADSGEPEQTGCTLRTVCRQYGVYDSTMEDAFRSIAHKTPQQIQAAARILEACTPLRGLQRDGFPGQRTVRAAVQPGISTSIWKRPSLSRGLSDAFQLSRSKLYELSAQYLGCGIAAYIRRRRRAGPGTPAHHKPAHHRCGRAGRLRRLQLFLPGVQGGDRPTRETVSPAISIRTLIVEIDEPGGGQFPYERKRVRCLAFLLCTPFFPTKHKASVDEGIA